MKRRYYLRLFGNIFIRVPRWIYNGQWHGMSGMVDIEFSPKENTDEK